MDAPSGLTSLRIHSYGVFAQAWQRVNVFIDGVPLPYAGTQTTDPGVEQTILMDMDTTQWANGTHDVEIDLIAVIDTPATYSGIKATIFTDNGSVFRAAGWGSFYLAPGTLGYLVSTTITTDEVVT